MNDYISRQNVINVLKEKVFHNLTDEFYEIIQILDELPSIQLERKQGWWIDEGEENGKRIWHCSECKAKEVVPTTTSFVTGILYPQWGFCPNCGAKMDGEV